MTTTASNLLVRPATLDDLDVLVDFNAAMAMETEANPLDRAVLHAGVAGVLAESRRGFYLVAECADVVAGCLMITCEWSDWRNGDWWWLQSVYVRPQYRRSGVFRALYTEIERRAAARTDVIGIRLYVEKENIRAQKTYAALGLSEEHYRMYGKTLRTQSNGNAG